MNRRITVLAMATAGMLTLSGCIGGGGGGDDDSPDSGGKVKLTYASYAFQAPTIKATQDIVDSWNAGHPNIQVAYQKVDPNSVHDKLVTQFAGNSAPDIVHDEAADIAGFARQGYLANVSKYIGSDLKSDVPDSVWKSVTVDDKVVGIPTIAQVYNVFANTDALKTAGIELPTTDSPWTWDDLEANAKTLTKGGGTYGFAWGLNAPVAGLMSSGLAFDGTWFSGDEAKPDIKVGDNELEVAKRIRRMLDDKAMAPNSVSVAGTDVLPGFLGGKYAMIMAGNYVETQIEEKAGDDFHWTMLPLLKGTSQNQASNPQTLSVARQSKHPEQAMEFISYFMKAEQLAKIAEGDALIPMTESAAAAVKKDLGTDHGWDAILGSAANLVDAPWQAADAFPQWKSEIATPAFQEYLAGRIDESELSKRLTDGWDKANQ